MSLNTYRSEQRCTSYLQEKRVSQDKFYTQNVKCEQMKSKFDHTHMLTVQTVGLQEVVHQAVANISVQEIEAREQGVERLQLATVDLTDNKEKRSEAKGNYAADNVT